MPRFESVLRILLCLSIFFSAIPPTPLAARSAPQPHLQTDEPAPTDTPIVETTATETATVSPTDTPIPLPTAEPSPTSLVASPTITPAATATATPPPPLEATVEAAETERSGFQIYLPLIVKYDQPQADFTANPLIGPAPLTVTFANGSVQATTYVWDFGDGTPPYSPPSTGGTGGVITHTYTQAGVYTVTLVAGNGVVSDTLTRQNYITPITLLTAQAEPEASFTATPLTGTAPLTVTFTNGSINTSSYLWDFGDGVTNTEINPTHIYTQTGVYTVTLTAMGLNGSHTLTKSNYITVTGPIVVSVTDTSGQAEAGLSVYAFNGANYSGYSKTTSSTGVATFTLPMGDYRFRADKNGTQFWSGTANHCTVPGCTTAVVTTSVPVVVSVADTNGQAEAGLSVYAFNGTTYSGYSKITNSTGVATFTLPLGDYRFRADKNGTQFWSGMANHCTVPSCTTAVVTTSIPVVVSVTDTSGQAEVGLSVYAFNGTSYTGFSKTTNSTGVATFTLPLGDYRFRADKNGTQFWSGTANHCTVPGCTTAVVTTSIPVMVTVTDTSGQAEAGLSVYAFDGTSYSGYSKTTNSTGVATFTLPLGDYRFRADKNGTQFWSGTANHCTVPGCVTAAVTTSVPVVVTVTDIANQPEANLSVYAFNGTTYTGYSKTTNSTGVATFTLPLGDYRFRADKNGTQFWSDLANHCSVPGCTTATVTTSVPVVVTVADTSGQAEAGLSVYAFNGTSYSGYSKTTNAAGQAAFTLPMGDYRFRADKNGTQFWSGTANHCTVPGCVSAVVTTSVPVAVTVTDTSGQAEAGLSVYAFNGTSYSGYSKTTNSTGVATFTLPLGDYRFRADKNGTQFWSGTANHCTVPGCTTAVVTTSVPVVVTVADTSEQAEADLSVYAFNGTSYTGYSKTTDSTGVATFTLPLGDYRFRADKNGTQFWSGTTNHCTVPGCVSAVVTTSIPVAVSVTDTSGQAEAGLSVYAFNGTSYTGFSKTTNSTGVATFTLPLGDYRFRADKNGTQFWSGTTNHCTVPGCITVTITLPSPPLSPVADFTAAPLTGVLPLTVTFTNSSTGTIEQYLWNFGDGLTSTLTQPTHLYAAAGVYTVSLTASGPAGSHTLTRTNYITAYEPVMADFSATPLTGTVPLTVTFSNTSTGATDYLWDFGTGATLTVISPTYTYAQPGVYTVTLTANGPGGSDTLTRTNYITVTEPVVAAFSATPLTGAVPLTVTLVNSSMGATDFLWDFGDGTASTVVSPTHTYTQAGVYTITLRASDGILTDTLTRTHYITAYEPVVADFSAMPLTGTAPLTVTFSNNSTGATDYLWDFGDSLTSTLVSPPHTYTQAGVYTVTLAASNGIVTDILTRPEYITVTQDATPLTVIATSPLSNGLVIAPNGVISVTFSRAINSNTVNTSTFTVRGQQTGLHTGVYTVAENTVQFAAATSFEPGEEIVVNLSQNIQATDGMTLAPYAWQFRAAVAGGAGFFSDSGQRLSSASLQDVAIGDLDRDGDLDVFAGNYDDAAVWLNDGAGGFSSSQSLSNLYALAVALGDVDNDGDLDAFIGNDGPNTVWLNDGAGNFSSSQSLGNSITLAVALGDVDGDGDLDAFVGDSDSNRVWLNDGAGVFSDSGQSLGNAENYAVALGDLDSDGDLDALVGNNNDSRVWLNDGAGVFSDSSQSLGNPYSNVVTLGDLDGDGDLDALIADFGAITIWFNDGNGSFSQSSQSLSISDVSNIALGDVDGDDDLDSFISSYAGNQVWLNDSLGNFSSSGQDFGNLSSEVTALGDLDGDGDLDIFVGRYYEANQVWLNQLPFTVTTTDPPGNGLAIAPGGSISATFSRAFSPSTVTTRTFTVRGSQTGVYTGTYLSSDDSAQFTGNLAFKPGEEIVVNLSRDLKAADGVALSPYAWQFRAEVSGGAGLFVDSQQRLGDTDSYAVALGDLDGDGDLDAFVGNYDSPNQIWWGDGLGNFSDSGQSLGDTNTQAVALGDVDGDGDLDAFIGTSYYGSQVWLNDGPGNFSDSGQSLGSEDNRAVALGDLDGDGDLDAFVGNQGSSEVWWNDGAGNFDNSNQSLDSSKAIALGDLDGDGDLDAFGGNYGGIVWFNDGAGYFSDSEYLDGDFETLTVALGDLDGDADLDAFLGNIDPYGQDSSNEVWLNDGAGSFSNSGQNLGDADTYAVALGDVDGDGDLDAFAANYGQDDSGGGGGQGSISQPVGASLALATSGQKFKVQPAGFAIRRSRAGSASMMLAVPQLDIIAGTQGNQVWLNDGFANFSSNGQLLGRANSRAVALGDLDSDGDLDAFIANDYQENGDNSDEVWLNQVPLMVMATRPAGNGLVITPAELISATFSLALSSSTVTTQTFTVRGSQTGIYEGLYTLLDNSAHFTATQAFKPGEEIVVNLSSGIKAEDGSRLTPYAWQFRTAVGDSPGRFNDSGRRLGNADTYAALLGDLDGDGDLDVFEGNYSGLYVWLNDGAGNFSDSGQSLSAYGVYGMALGDLDGDGDLDALAGDQVWLNDGAANFSAGPYMGYSAEMLALGDLDGDGDLDALANNQVWLNDGAANFSAGQNVGYYSNALALGDLDGDGDLDVFTTYYDGSQIWLNDGTANFSLGPYVDSAATYGLALGDLDGDGDLDALAGGYNYANLIYLNDGAGNFSDSGQNPGFSYRYAVALGDSDGDGDLDAIVSNDGNANELWLNDGAGNFSQSGQGLDGPNSQAIALGDLDGDGDLDAVVSNDAGQGYPIWLKQTLPDLTIGKTAPAVVAAGEPITYTLTVTNSGQLTATNLVITDTIPDGATYITGGLQVGDVVSWTVPSLAGGGSQVQVSFVVTAATTISNSDYRVSADDGITATGTTAPATFVVDFVAEPVRGVAPLTVTFTTYATPTAAITDYIWDYGDGTTFITATGNLTAGTPAPPHPHLYTQAGVYTVSLTAMGAGESAILTRTQYITVIAPITQNWQLMTPTTTSPPVAGEQAMTYDSARNRVVLYGGNGNGWPYHSSTWEFDGSDWLTITTTVSPTARYGAAMAYDPLREVTILFGGSNEADTALNQTWQYTNTQWSQVTIAATSPASRTYASMAAAPDGKIYLFGGNDGVTYYGDLWQYDGGTWEVITPTGQTPPARTLAAMTYDSINNRLFLFGGRSVTGTVLADFWVFDPISTTTWTPINFSSGPPARMAHSLTYDPAINSVILVGGATNNGDTLLGDTWHYHPWIGWIQAQPTTALPPRAYHQTTYGNNTIILFSNREVWKYE